MKISEKVIEGVVVVVFAVTVTVTAATAGQGNIQPEQYTQEDSYKEAATKEKAAVDVVAVAMLAENEGQEDLEVKDDQEAEAGSVEAGQEAKAVSEGKDGQEAKTASGEKDSQEAEAGSVEKNQAGKDASAEGESQEAKDTSAEKDDQEAKDTSAEKDDQEAKDTSAEKDDQEAKDTSAEKDDQMKQEPKAEEEKGAEAAAKVEEADQAQADDTESEADQSEDDQKKQNEKKDDLEEKEVSEWATKLMPNVEEYLNIRAEGSEDAEVVGKLRKGDSADILERGEEWSKISSGSVEGYVKNEFCVFDDAAEAMAYEMGTFYATSSTGGLRVRAEASMEEETEVVYVLEEGEKIKVDTEAEAPEGWVAVKASEETAYVSAEYVTVELKLGKAISIEEEQEAIRRAQEEAAAKQAKAAQASQSSGSTRTQNAPVAASYDDVTLLGALIQCEAGGECYEGQVAVGAVVMNRLRRGYGGSIYDVIYQSGQFSPASSGALASVLASGVSGSCLSAAQEAINGVDNVGGAIHFRRAGSGQDGIVIGNHVFY